MDLLCLFLLVSIAVLPSSHQSDTWTEDVASEDQTGIVLNHEELYDYEEEAANWTSEAVPGSGNITGELTWTKPLSNLSRQEGEAVKMRCEVRGSPGPLQLRWLKNELPLPGTEGRRRLTVRTVSTGDRLASRLRLARLEVHDSAFYSCQARNGLGQVSATTGVLRVHMSPLWGESLVSFRQC